ncbi:MAG TPA: hypothetical protein VLX68_10875 [Chitinivibrionales bacterium]|nr:hypothetical protein [Chitinivibrionales bacterium]
MAYIGIGYSGQDGSFLRNQVDKYFSWLQGERRPHFFGDGFVVLYDSNTAREFAKKCGDDAGAGQISVYPMDHPLSPERS